MVTVLYGRMGTGKSTAILEMIEKDASCGREAVLIVPEQKTVIAERDVAYCLSPSAQLYADATNFTRLANRIFRKVGGIKYNYVTKSGKNLIMYRAICEVRESLREYKIAPGKEKSAVSTFLDAVGELKTYGVTADMILQAAKSVDNEKLSGRLRDLALVNSVYERILYERYSDPYDDMEMLARKLRETSVLKDTNVYIDSFYGFTGAQWDVIREIAGQVNELTIALDMPMDGVDSDYAKITDTSDRIEKMCRRMGIRLTKREFTEDKLHKNSTISYLSDNLWRFDAPALKNHGGVSLISPSDEFDECEYVASEIKRLVMDGAKYSDIAVIMGNGDAYDGIIDFTFDKFDIPYFFSKRSVVTGKPLIKAVFTALSAVDSFKAQDICDFIKCGYTDITPEECGILEDYMRRWGINGRRKFENDEYWAANPDGFVADATEEQMRTLDTVLRARESVRALLSPLRDGFDKKESCGEIVKKIYGLISEMKVRDKLKAEIREQDKEEAIKTAQVYDIFINALDTVYEIMGDYRLNPEAAARVLSYALDGVKIGSIPTGEDKVTVGSASEIRVKKADYVFILGACAGKFPANIQDDGFFSDDDKISLEGCGIVLSSLSEVRSGDELLNFKNAVSTASDKLWILAPKNDIRGGKNEPSMAFLRVRELLSGINTVNTEDIPLYERIYTEAGAREYSAIGTSELASAIGRILPMSEGTRGYSNKDASICESSAREIFTSSVNMTQSRIEAFVLCHFKYYCDYLLKLRDNKRISFASREIGNLSHAVFEGFFKKIKSEGWDMSSLTDTEIERTVDEIMDGYIDSVCCGVRSKRLDHLFGRLRKSIYIFTKNMVGEFAQSEFAPEFFELPIGIGDDSVPPLKFPVGDNADISLYGICDRVDIYRKDKEIYVRVVDYKSGSKAFSRSDIKDGMGLQMLIYLFSLCKMGDCAIRTELLPEGGDIKPAGIMYYPLNIGKAVLGSEGDLYSDSNGAGESGAVEKGIKRSGIFTEDKELLRAQDKELKGRYIPEYSKKQKNSFVSYEDFDSIFEEMGNALCHIGEEMLKGRAEAEPREKRGSSPCDYCASRAVCRRRS